MIDNQTHKYTDNLKLFFRRLLFSAVLYLLAFRGLSFSRFERLIKSFACIYFIAHTEKRIMFYIKAIKNTANTRFLNRIEEKWMKSACVENVARREVYGRETKQEKTSQFYHLLFSEMFDPSETKLTNCILLPKQTVFSKQQVFYVLQNPG